MAGLCLSPLILLTVEPSPKHGGLPGTFSQWDASHPTSQLVLPEEQAKLSSAKPGPRLAISNLPAEGECLYLLPFGAVGKASGFISSVHPSSLGDVAASSFLESFFKCYFWVFSPLLNTAENPAGAERNAGGEGANAAAKAGTGAGGGGCG